jgi:hypothetical protein
VGPGSTTPGPTRPPPVDGRSYPRRRYRLATLRVARSHSLFMPVMDISGISLGQAVAHSPANVQPPKPYSSIWATMSRTRVSRSGAPCGSVLKWLILAEVKSMAEPFGQAATHAPQPMHSACSKA